MTYTYEWLLLLPREALSSCVAELVEASKTTRFPATYASWKSTAEVHANPELAGELATATEGDGVGEAVPPPCVCLCHPLGEERIIATCVCCR